MKPDYGNMESTAGVLGRSCMLDLTPSPSRVVAAFLTDHDVDGRDAEYYDEHIQRGGIFVSVDTRLAEGQADALSLGVPGKTLEEEIAELRSSEKVDAELEAMKAALGKASEKEA